MSARSRGGGAALLLMLILLLVQTADVRTGPSRTSDAPATVAAGADRDADADADAGVGRHETDPLFRIEPMVFGIDADAAPDLKAAGLPVDHGVLWVGTWNLEHGWRDVDRQLLRLREANVTPALHLYYWGDDISPSCFERGCWSEVHAHDKDGAGWRRLAGELVERLNRTMEGDRVLVLVENEFNKAEVARYEPLDEGLAAMARFLHAAYPAAKVVMPLGNWNHGAWGTWDRFAAESDYVGVQAMRASTRHSAEAYLEVYNDTLAAVRELRVRFHQPILIQDLALSSYPEPEFLPHQAEALGAFFDEMDALKEAGVEALYYRALVDDRGASRLNHFGVAERHWGLLQTPEGPEKPAARVWYEGVQAEHVPEGPDAPDGPDARQGPPAPDPFPSPVRSPEAVEERGTPSASAAAVVALLVGITSVGRARPACSHGRRRVRRRQRLVRRRGRSSSFSAGVSTGSRARTMDMM